MDVETTERVLRSSTEKHGHFVNSPKEKGKFEQRPHSTVPHNSPTLQWGGVGGSSWFGPTFHYWFGTLFIPTLYYLLSLLPVLPKAKYLLFTSLLSLLYLFFSLTLLLYVLCSLIIGKIIGFFRLIK